MLLPVIGTDFAGSNFYRTKTKKEPKANILTFSFIVNRVVHLELISNKITQEFIKCLKRSIALRGKHSSLYSDNGSSQVTKAERQKLTII